MNMSAKRVKAANQSLSPDLLRKLDAYWRAANYLSVGRRYLYDNPLLRRSLTLADVKHMLLGHWGTTPGQNFIYVHLNRVIKKYDLDVIYVSGPGHGGPAVVGNTYLEGTYSEIYPDISQDEAGLRKLFIQFSFPGGIPSHASPECPGSLHEGGELGDSLSHPFGAVFDNPDLIVACVVGDGEAETGPLATAWHSSKFLDPATDGVVLPILHLNGYKISNPTLLARITHEELEQLLRGYGWTPYFVEGHEPGLMHEAMAVALDAAVEQIKEIQHDARVHRNLARPRWPMIVPNSPKGWTGPKPDFRDYAVEVPTPGVREIGDSHVLGPFLRDVVKLNSEQRNFRVFGPDETVAAVSLKHEHLPDLKIRVVNVVNLMKLQPQTEHPHGLSDMDFDELFTKDKPVIFGFHAYPWLIHRLTYRRTNHDNIHVRGYKEEGTITTPFDMTVMNELDRFHLVMDTIDRVPQAGAKGICLKQQLKDKLGEHKQYIAKYGQDMPEIRNWKWSNPT
jgi:phosphoketolase